jgi:hypothetical protein
MGPGDPLLFQEKPTTIGPGVLDETPVELEFCGVEASDSVSDRRRSFDREVAKLFECR